MCKSTGKQVGERAERDRATESQAGSLLSAQLKAGLYPMNCWEFNQLCLPGAPRFGIFESVRSHRKVTKSTQFTVEKSKQYHHFSNCSVIN